MSNIGKIVRAVGPVVDIAFNADFLPALNTAIQIDNQGESLTVEVAQHIGDDIVRCIAMGPTDGLIRGLDAIDTGAVSYTHLSRVQTYQITPILHQQRKF